MDCDKYLELLALRLDGVLSQEEERELEAHLAACPDCRAAGAQLAALQPAFHELEDVPAPEGFAQGVMDRIRAADTPKVIPLFKRPQFRALAGLAACLVLVVGLYGAARQSPTDTADAEGFDLMAHSFSQDGETGDEERPRVNAALVDPEPADAPQVTAYAAPSPAQTDVSDGTAGLEKLVPEDGAGLESAGTMARDAELVLTLDRLPEGAEELIRSSEAASAVEIDRNGNVCYRWVTLEGLSQVEQMAQEQDIFASRASGTEESGRYVIIVLNPTE